jgi:hypothetical protein
MQKLGASRELKQLGEGFTESTCNNTHVAQKETFLYEQGRLEKGEPQVF